MAWIYVLLALLPVAIVAYFFVRDLANGVGDNRPRPLTTPQLSPAARKRKERKRLEVEWDAQFVDLQQAAYFADAEDPRCYRCHGLFEQHELTANTCHRCLAEQVRQRQAQLGEAEAERLARQVKAITLSAQANRIEMGSYRHSLRDYPCYHRHH